MTSKRKGSYQRSDAQRATDNRPRSHKAGNPHPDVVVNGTGAACDRWFSERGMKPSISKILQTRGIDIGVKVWVSRKGKNV